MESHHVAALIILPIVIIGTMANWTIVILSRNLKSLKNAFGRLTLSQSMGDAFHSTTFVFYVVPMCYFNNQWMKDNSKYFGHVLIIAYEISTYSHLFISLNRFSSIMFPMKYDSIFSMKSTNIIISIFWVYAIIPSFFLYAYNDCHLFYNEDVWGFTFSTTPICLTITWYSDFIKNCAIVIFIVVIDIVTVIKVRMFNKHLFIATTSTKRTNEMNFLKQACCQALVFVCELTSFFIIAPRIDSENRWLGFFLSTVPWVCVTSLDGVITIIFNMEFARLISNSMKRCIKRNAVATHLNSMERNDTI